MVLVDWNIYGVSLSGVSLEDIKLVCNIFATNILLINILFLIFMNQNLFIFDFNKKKLFESLKRDYSYWATLFLIILFTFYYMISWPTGDIMNIYFLYSPCGIEFKPFLLGEFNSRYTLLSVYKILAIYVAFGSSNRSLGYRLLIWFILIVLIKIASFNSAFIVDVLVCSLTASYDVDNLKLLYWKIYFESLLSYSSNSGSESESESEDQKEIKKLRKSLEKRRDSVETPPATSFASQWMRWTESTAELHERLNDCHDKVGSGLDCGRSRQTTISQAVELGYPSSGAVLAKTEGDMDSGERVISKYQQFSDCVNNINWKEDKALRDAEEEADAKLKVDEEKKKADELAHDEWRWRG